MTKRAVFLDRDGVLIRSDLINGKPIAVQEPERMELLAGVEEACARLKALDFHLVMVTNQPDLARGLVQRKIVDQMNGTLAKRLGLDAVRVCPHLNEAACDCRKPAPGMLTDATRELGINLRKSFMVGDRWRDIEAGHRAGCNTVYIDWGHAEPMTVQPDHIASSLLNAVAWIAEQSTPS
jgi:D-glycero-D-manno-heptose 1,7-bisphosphate phosphatase